MRQLRVELTRKELYDKIWSKPTYLVAQDLSIAYNTLAVLCRQHEIPIPYNGYWSAQKAGKSPWRTPLAEPTQWQPHTIEIKGVDFIRVRLQRLARAKGVKTPPISVRTHGPLLHPLAHRTQKLLERPRLDEAGILLSRLAYLDHFRVSRATISRALRILDALFTAFDQEPFQLSWPEGSDTRLTVLVLGEPLRFVLAEIVKSTRHKPTHGEIFRQKHDWFWRPSRFDYKLTGKLQIVIDGIKGDRLRHVWSDGKRSVETCLPEFLVALVGVAQELKRERGHGQTWRQRWDRARAQALHGELTKEESRRGVALLNQCFTEWLQARNVAQFLRFLERKVDKLDSSQERKNARAILKKARAYIDSIDPSRNLTGMMGRLESGLIDLRSASPFKQTESTNDPRRRSGEGF